MKMVNITSGFLKVYDKIKSGVALIDKDKNSNEPDFNKVNMTDEELLDEFERAKRIICDEIPKAPPDEFEIIWQRIMREEDEK